MAFRNCDSFYIYTHAIFKSSDIIRSWSFGMVSNTNGCGQRNIYANVYLLF